MTGKTISHFKIIEKLGSGGMGVVYKAEDTRLKRQVALKFLPSAIAEDSEERIRFEREAQAAAALDHPCIAAVHEIAESEGQMFIVMACVEGVSLKKKIKSGPLTVEEAIDIAIQIAQGLKEAHDLGIVHRDIKSSNVIVSPKGQVKITDFGLAKFKGEKTLTKSGAQMGSASYMSPEQIRGEPVDHQSDLFSIGVVLYEMLTGQLPFKGEDVHAQMFSIVYDLPQPVAMLKPEVPEALERIVERALKKQKEQRYQSIDELLTDLQALKRNMASGQAVHFDPGITKKGKRHKSTRDRKRARLKRVTIPLAFALLLSAAFVLFRLRFHEQGVTAAPRPIAIMPFENQSGDKRFDYLTTAIPNLLITNLEQSKYLSVLTWERMRDMLKAMGNKDLVVADMDKETGFDLCKKDGVQEIVFGSFTKAGDMFATEIKVLDVKTKRLLKSTNSRGKGIGSILEYQVDELSQAISYDVSVASASAEEEILKVAEVTTHSMEAYNYFLRGRDDWEKRYADDARKFLEKAVEFDSTYAAAYLYLAETYGLLGNMKARKEAYEKAKMYAHKATDKERLYIEANYAGTIERNPEKRFWILKQLAKKYPKEKRIHDNLASYYKGRKLFQQAITEFKKALELDPNYGLAYNKLAFTYSDMGEFEKAIECFKRYAALSPGDANPFDSIGEIYLRMGRLDAALAKYKEATEVKPDYFYAYRTIAYIYALQEKYEEAMEWTDTFIEVAPSQGRKTNGYAWKGFYCFWLGRQEQSFHEFSKAIDLLREVGNEAGEAYVHWIMGWIYYERGQLDLGEKHFKQWHDKINSTRPGPGMTGYDKFSLAWRDLKLGRVDSARTRVSEIRALLPQIVPVYQAEFKYYSDLLYAETLFAEDSLKKAIVFWQKVLPLQMPPVYPWYLLFYNVPYPKDILARAYLQKGELDKAIAEYERLTSFDSKSKDRRLIYPVYHYKLANLYERKGWSEKAIERYERFLQIWHDADAHLPELIDAKARLAKLRGK